MSLTQKQQQFVREVVSGKPASAAYRLAYQAGGMRPNTVHREAHRLMTNPKVATRVGELVAEADRQAIQHRVATREEVLATISELMASGEPRDSVRLKAAETMGKHHGLFAERVAVEQPQRSSEELEAELIRRLREYGIISDEPDDGDT